MFADRIAPATVFADRIAPANVEPGSRTKPSAAGHTKLKSVQPQTPCSAPRANGVLGASNEKRDRSHYRGETHGGDHRPPDQYTVATGKVISQDPASGSSVAPGSPVSLVISSGPQMVTVPNVEGLTQDAATTAITAAKLAVGTLTQQTSNTVATGKVISQDPTSGSSVVQGSPLNLVISSGPQMVTMPNVEGLTQAAATTAITGAKLMVGTLTQQTSNTVATGNVISQDPASGSSVAQGSPVNLVISSGPQMVTMPNVEGLTKDAATTAITGTKLTVGAVTQQSSNTVGCRQYN